MLEMTHQRFEAEQFLRVSVDAAQSAPGTHFTVGGNQ